MYDGDNTTFFIPYLRNTTGVSLWMEVSAVFDDNIDIWNIKSRHMRSIIRDIM